MNLEKQQELLRLEWGCATVGTVVVLVGLFMVSVHFRTRRRLTDFHLSDYERQFLRKQYFRRLQTSSLLIGLGALIALFGRLKSLDEYPLFATGYVGVMLLLCLWLVLLGVGDAVASRAYHRREARRHQSLDSSLRQAMAEVDVSRGESTSK